MHLPLLTTLTALLVLLPFTTPLPYTFELHTLDLSGTRIGCLNGYGHLVTSSISCYIFRSRNSTSDTSAIAGYETCHACGGVLDCYSGGEEVSLFGMTDGDLDLEGRGTQFSTESLPDEEDRSGVAVSPGIGGEGSLTFVVQVHAVSG